MSTTRPAPPSTKRPYSLRVRWRSSMLLGLNLLVFIVVGSASLIMLLSQRQSTLRMHEAAAQQVRAAIHDASDNARLTIDYAAQTLSAETAKPADLTRLLQADPALTDAAIVGDEGIEVVAIPGSERYWSENVAWLVNLLEEPGAALSGDPARWWITASLADGSGVLIVQADPQLLWRGAVSSVSEDVGYAYLVSSDGALLTISPHTGREAGRDPGDFGVFKTAREGHPDTAVYQGLQGSWVLGRAELVRGAGPNTGYVVITETPLSQFVPSLVRGLALWAMALVLTFLLAEWLIRRILRTVVRPLEILRQGARAVGAGDYRYRIRLPSDTDRELAELGRTFNEMIERLQESQDQIEAYTHEMEEIVELRARELSRKAMQLEVAAQVSSKIATILDPRALNDEVSDLIKERFKVYHVEILIVDNERGVLLPSKSRRKTALGPIPLADAETSVIAWVARHSKTLLVPDVKEEPRYRRFPELPASQSEVAIPLKFGARVIGVLNMESEHRNGFARDDIAVLESLANEIAVSLHNAQVFDALETANRDLAQASLQAKQANMLKSRFLLNASHKLRTPLNSIIGYSETILSGIYGDLSDTLLDRQRRILENGRLLQALIEDMLDLSAIESGHMELKFGWLNLPPLLEEVMNASRALYQAGYPEHRLILRLNVKDSLPCVWADVDRLRYMLINLMGNAVKFTESGEVVMSAESDQVSVSISVRDTGPGISEEDQAFLFEPFQHERGSIAAGGRGTGLGLPVSRLLAMMHGGELSVDSIPRKGSVFTLRLPRRPGDEEVFLE